jgi:dTDP-4-amino-4,6-dideoxygalactose transaminase
MIISSRAPTPRDNQDLQEIASVLLSNNDISGNSSFITDYEQKLCTYFNVKYTMQFTSNPLSF